MIASLSDVYKQSARQRIDCFVQRFDDSYRKLTYYAALPLVLTPELLNYLRNQFLRGEVPWVAEIDLLLSDLCSPTGYEQYVMDTAVRAVLLEEMEQVLGQDRMEAVARLLIDYVRKLARTTPHLGERSLQAQQWAAMVYLDDQRQTAVQQIARSLQDAVQDATGQAESQAGLPAANQAELAQLARITQELAPQLGRYTNLLDYAKVVSQLLVAPTSTSSEMLERSYSVEGIELRLPVVDRGQVKIAQPKVEGQSGDRLVTSSNKPKKILLLAANPKGTTRLRLDEEVREIDAGLQRAKNRDQFVLEQKWAVRLRDIRRTMLDSEPSIVHFSGYGTGGDEGLVFEDETGIAKLVAGEALAGLFELFADRVECVVLDGCYSEVQATAIARHVNYVIGMKKAIGDRAAIEFAVGFYDALGSGETVEFAYEIGCAAIRLAGVPEQLTPILKKKPNIGETVPKISFPSDQPSSTKEDTSLLSTEPIEVFFIYSYKDEDLRDELAKHLSILKRQGIITAWHDREISDGTEWAGHIDEHLNTAQIILLLISPDFLASDYCYDIELTRAMERHAAQEAYVIPVILGEFDWKGAPFGKLQALPKDALPVTNWENRDRAFADVARGIRQAVEELKKQSTSRANSQVSPPSVEVEQELNDSDIEILTDLLIRSGRAQYSARRALCIKTGVEPNRLGFLRESSDADFAVLFINFLHNIDDKQALCKISKELEVVFKRGKYSADLENIKSKLNCK